MNTAGMYQSNYLTAQDLAGRTYELVISGASMKEFDDKQNPGRKQQKIVVNFNLTDGRATQKGLILNKAQYAAIVAMCGGAGIGEETDNWIGKRVMLSPAKTNNGYDTINLIASPNNPAVNQRSFATAGPGVPAAQAPALQAAPAVPAGIETQGANTAF